MRAWTEFKSHWAGTDCWCWGAFSVVVQHKTSNPEARQDHESIIVYRNNLCRVLLVADYYIYTLRTKRWKKMMKTVAGQNPNRVSDSRGQSPGNDLVSIPPPWTELCLREVNQSRENSPAMKAASIPPVSPACLLPKSKNSARYSLLPQTFSSPEPSPPTCYREDSSSTAV